MLRNQAARGLKWQVLEMVGRQGISLVVFMILARLLRPADFGLVGLVGAYLAFINIFVEQGIGTALVQRRQLEPDHLDTAFWFGLACAVVMCGGTVLLAAPLAELASEPRIVPLLRWASLAMVINAFGAVHASLYVKELDFKFLTFRAMLGNIVGGSLAIAMALNGYGVWSLISQQLIAVLSGVAYLWTVSPWRPAWRFSLPHLRQLLGVSGSVFATSLLWTLSSRIDQIVVGRFVGAFTLGQYVVGIKLADVVRTAVHEPIAAVSMPALSKVQADFERLRNAIYKAMELHAAVCFPVFVGLASVATDVVPLVFGEQWRDAAGVLRLFALYSLGVALSALYHPALLASGGPGRYVFVSIACAVGATAACLVGIQFGVSVMISLLTLNIFAMGGVALLFLRTRIQLNVWRFCQLCVVPAGASLAMFLVVTLTRMGLDGVAPPWVSAAAQVAIGAVTYVSLFALWAPQTLARLRDMAAASLSREHAAPSQLSAHVDAGYQA